MEMRTIALRAEEAGFDTVWVADELLYIVDEWGGAHGFWEVVAVTGAIAEATNTVNIGTWVLSALHRKPALTAKVAETIDEISGGRFVFGYGAGHSGRQGKAFGFAEANLVSRYEESLEIIVPLLRKEGVVEYHGHYHSAEALEQRPVGPRPGHIPILLAGHGPRNIGLAVKHGDIWSAFATTDSRASAFKEMVELVDRTCEEAGRDPESLGRSVGVWVEPGEASVAEELGLGVPLSGSVDQIAQAVLDFADIGVTRVELNMIPSTPEAIEIACEVRAAIAD
jgi:alkanesulfonate monooxygenase SsuD/methylene tetrahydromethanopterin reductase-like flavin-dependent oxidoreductase (luciferase family)